MLGAIVGAVVGDRFVGSDPRWDASGFRSRLNAPRLNAPHMLMSTLAQSTTRHFASSRPWANQGKVKFVKVAFLRQLAEQDESLPRRACEHFQNMEPKLSCVHILECETS